MTIMHSDTYNDLNLIKILYNKVGSGYGCKRMVGKDKVK